MAKISARGDKEQARWRRTRDSQPGAPYEMVLTMQGRLLYKAQRTDSFTLRRVGRGVNFNTVSAQAAMFRMERV